MVDATAIIMTRNESKNIAGCLQSIKGFAKRAVVIDCGSTDDTVEIAKDFGADIYFHEFEYYAKQFNWGLANTDIDTEWAIRLDADEQFPPELCAEIEQLIEAHRGDNMNGIIMEAKFFFLGRWIKHGPRHKRKLMMFKYSCGRIEDRLRDAHSVISEGYSICVKNKFLHYDLKSFDCYIQRYNWYATRELQDYIAYTQGANVQINTDVKIQKQRRKKFNMYYKAPKFIRAWLWFVYNYVFRLGFLDGVSGFLFCYLSAIGIVCS